REGGLLLLDLSREGLQLVATFGEGLLVGALGELGHRLVGGVALGGEGLGLHDQAPAPLREGAEGFHGAPPARGTTAESLADLVQVLGYVTRVQHEGGLIAVRPRWQGGSGSRGAPSLGPTRS